MTEKAKKRPRVNVQIPENVELYLEQMMDETSLPKSSVLVMALQEWYQAKKNIEQMSNLSDLMKQLKEMSDKLDDKEALTASNK